MRIARPRAMRGAGATKAEAAGSRARRAQAFMMLGEVVLFTGGQGGQGTLHGADRQSVIRPLQDERSGWREGPR
jgi:hypothetical protein